MQLLGQKLNSANPLGPILARTHLDLVTSTLLISSIDKLIVNSIENLSLLRPVCRSALCTFIIQKFWLGLNELELNQQIKWA